MKSGAVRESSTLVRIEPIDGPGICGADYPLKVAALGEASALGFADIRPPGAIPGPPAAAQPHWPVSRPVYGAPPSPVMAPSDVDRGMRPLADAPMSITPPGVAPVSDIAREELPEPDVTPPLHAPRSMPPRHAAPPDSAIDAPFNTTPLSQQKLVGTPRRAAMPPSQPAEPDPVAPVRFGPERGPFTTALATPVEVKPTATLACPIVSALDRWITTAVQPSAQRWFNQPVVAIKQISAYSCRGMNGNPNARISEHAFGNALDIAGFVLADGRKITIKDGWHGSPEEQGFLRDVQLAACDTFTTVLAPGSNVYHYDHIHVDLMRRSSRRSICKPAAVPGEVIAAKVRARYAGRRIDPAVTGSIERVKAAVSATAADRADEADDDHAFIGHALPGDLRSLPGHRN